MTKQALKEELKRAALIVGIAAVPATATPAHNASLQNDTHTAVNPNNGLQRSNNIRILTPNGRTVTRQIYNWQEIVSKYYLEPSEFSKGTKLSKEQELDCAAALRAIAKCEAKTASSIEDKYYHDNLLGKISDNECEAKIKEAQANAKADKKSFTQIISEERKLLESDKNARKEALKELEEFRNKDDLNKGIFITDKTDKEIEQSNGSQSKTLSAALFLKNMRQNG